MELRVWRRGVGVLAMAACAAALLVGCGEDEEADRGPSPLHAVGSVLKLEDTTGEIIQAQLILVTTVGGEAAFVDTALAPTLQYAGESRPLRGQRVRLQANTAGEMEETTFYQLSSRQDATLGYEAGAEYVFKFSVDGPEAGAYAGEIFELRVSAPSAAPSVEVVSTPGRETLLDVAAPAGYAAGVLQVDRPGSNETTFVSFPYSDRFLSSAGQLLEARPELERFKGGVVTAPASSFSRGGTHLVSFFGLGLSSAGRSIGAQSVGIAGEAASTSVDIP